MGWIQVTTSHMLDKQGICQQKFSMGIWFNTALLKSTSNANRLKVEREKQEVKDKVVFLLLAIFPWQQIGWSCCAASRRFGLVAWRNTKKKVTFTTFTWSVLRCLVTIYG